MSRDAVRHEGRRINRQDRNAPLKVDEWIDQVTMPIGKTANLLRGKGCVMNGYNSGANNSGTTDVLHRSTLWQTRTYVPEPGTLVRPVRGHDTVLGGLSGNATGRQNTNVSEVSSREGDGLPDFLVNQGNVPIAKVLWALQEQERSGVFFGELLEKTGILKDNSIVDLLVHHTRMPYLSLRDYLLDKNALSLIPAEFCRKYRLLPVDKLGRSLTVAMVNPLNYDAIKALAGLLPEWRIQQIICSNHEFVRSLERYYNQPVFNESLPAVS